MSHENNRSTSSAVRVAEGGMALCLGVMAVAVFSNVVLRYGFHSGIPASEELSRLLFVWMVFIGAAAAYPAGEHMAVTALFKPLARPGREGQMRLAVRGVHALVLAASLMLAWGAWQQVVVGMGSISVVLGYNAALLPLPAFLCAMVIAVFAFVNLLRAKPVLQPDHLSDVE
jgi:TRAP-type C4-dicarboxylate transport system permease small subunit